MSLSYGNQSIDLQSKSIDWFLCEEALVVKGLKNKAWYSTLTKSYIIVRTSDICTHHMYLYTFFDILTLPAPCISESCIEIKSKSNFISYGAPKGFNFLGHHIEVWK